jgi:hypothetical protein
VTPTTEAGKRLLDDLWYGESPEPNSRTKSYVWWLARREAEKGLPAIEAEAARAALQSLRERVEGLFIPADYVRDNGVDGKMTWPDGWDSGIERVLAEIDRALNS